MKGNMKKFTIEVSHASPAQLSTIALELKIMSNGWAKFGPRITINGQKLQAPSLRIPGSGRKHGPRNGKPQASSQSYKVKMTAEHGAILTGAKH